MLPPGGTVALFLPSKVKAASLIVSSVEHSCPPDLVATNSS